jgi:hypothetical protein
MALDIAGKNISSDKRETKGSDIPQEHNTLLWQGLHCELAAAQEYEGTSWWPSGEEQYLLSKSTVENGPEMMTGWLPTGPAFLFPMHLCQR